MSLASRIRRTRATRRAFSGGSTCAPPLIQVSPPAPDAHRIPRPAGASAGGADSSTSNTPDLRLGVRREPATSLAQRAVSRDCGVESAGFDCRQRALELLPALSPADASRVVVGAL